MNQNINTSSNNKIYNAMQILNTLYYFPYSFRITLLILVNMLREWNLDLVFTKKINFWKKKFLPKMLLKDND